MPYHAVSHDFDLSKLEINSSGPLFTELAVDLTRSLKGALRRSDSANIYAAHCALRDHLKQVLDLGFKVTLADFIPYLAGDIIPDNGRMMTGNLVELDRSSKLESIEFGYKLKGSKPAISIEDVKSICVSRKEPEFVSVVSYDRKLHGAELVRLARIAGGIPRPSAIGQSPDNAKTDEQILSELNPPKGARAYIALGASGVAGYLRVGPNGAGAVVLDPRIEAGQGYIEGLGAKLAALERRRSLR